MNWIRKIILAMAVLSLAACGGGGGSPGANPNDGALSVSGVTAVALLPGESRSITVSGGVEPYKALSQDQSVAVAAISGNQLIIGGQATGSTSSTDVTVTDRRGTAVKVTVTIGSSVPLKTNAPANLTVGVGADAARTFTVAGGVKPYRVESQASLVASVTTLVPDGSQWRVQGVAIGGPVVVRITDAVGEQLLVNVTVGAPEFRISSDTLTLPIGVPATVVLSGGQKPYSVAGGIGAAIEVTPVDSDPMQNDEYRIEGLLVSELDVVFMDAAGQTVKVTVTVNNASTQFRVSPSAISLGERSGSVAKFTVIGLAPGAFSVFSSNPTLVTTGNLVQLVLNPDGTVQTNASFEGTVQTANPAACVGADTAVTLTVIDSTGSVGTSVVTITDTDSTCP